MTSGYLPRTITGANVSLHALCRRLIPAGYDPLVVCAAEGKDTPGGVNWSADYPVLRLVEPVAAIAEMIPRLAPDAVVVRGLPAASFAAGFKAVRDFPLRIYLTANFVAAGFPAPRDAPSWRFAANSRFLTRLGEAFVGRTVSFVPSLVEPRDYVCRPRGDTVLFINPIADKGVHIASAIARRLPHRKFLFVRSWPDHEKYPHIEVSLPNIEWSESRLDMRPLYARARLLLVPSVLEESSSRSVAEAQLSGIPVVASDRGGLPESVGRGGIQLPIGDPVAHWSDAVESLFRDQAKHRRLSRLARRHAARPEIAPAQALRSFLRFIAP